MTRTCEHVKSNGHFCQSPAIRGRNYCFFHLNHLGRKLRAEKHATQGHFAFELPLLEDAASIQLALMQVTNALLHGLLDPKRGGLVLYALQTASCNLRNMAKESQAEETAPICNQYDSFEADYDLEDHAAELRVEDAPRRRVPDPSHTEPNEDTLAALRAADAPDSPYASRDLHWLLDYGVAHGYLEPMYPSDPSPKTEVESAPMPGYDFDAPGTANPLDTADTPETAEEFDRPAPALHPSEAVRPASAPPDSAQPALDSAQPAPDQPKLRDPNIAVPYQLTHRQYNQAKFAIVEYERAHKLVHDTRKPVAQRAAISQQPLLGLRKPPQSFPAATSENPAQPGAAPERNVANQ